MSIPVLAVPAIDPGTHRLSLTLPEGLTLAEIVAAALPGLADRRQLRVALAGPRGATVIPPEHWARLRPKSGVQVVIRVVPGKTALRSVLQIVVSLAAFALGSAFGPAVGAMLGVSNKVGAALLGLGVNMLGGLLINALIPPVKSDAEERNTYSISGWRNRLTPDGAVPVVLGQIRYAPPFAAVSYTEVVGDWQYLRALFTFGEGSLDLTDFRIGETSLSEYDEVEIEVRQGLAGDLPVTLYPRQIYEESIGVDLTRPLPRDDLGEVTGDPTEDEPVVRTTGGDAASASVILAFPAGLVNFDAEGNKGSHSVSIRIEQRLVTAEEWSPVEVLDITASQTEAFYRQHSWALPSRGRWQVRITMLTDETEADSIKQRCVWAALQTIRPEYPLAYPRPLALVALRVKATHQLNGQLDNFSALSRRICPDWDAVSGTWITRATSNPASLYRWILQTPANPKAVADGEVDLAALAEWHVFCADRGLHYNRVLDQTGTALREALAEVAAAGRATPRHDGTRWGVVIDRPAELVVDHISPRNSWGLNVRRSYAERPHALVVNFQDGGNDFKTAQRVIRHPDYLGDITLTEELAMPGLTDASVVYREALRRFYEVEYRPDVFQVTQDGLVRTGTRGDTVALSADILRSTQSVARVRRVLGPMIELDDQVMIDAGESYSIRFRVFEARDPWEEPDTIGTSAVRNVTGPAGEGSILTVSGTGPMPQPGDLIHFGVAATLDYELVITGVESTQDECAILRCVAAAPEIDTLTAAAVIPAWSSRVGEELDPSLLAPPEPRFVSVRSVWNGSAYRIVCLIVPGSGAVQTASYVLEHRAGTAGAWTAITLPVASGGGEITGYARDATMQVRARAVGLTGTAGPDTPAITLVVGAADAAIPAALEADAVTLSALPGGARVEFATGSDVATTQVQVYRSTSATLDRETDAVGSPVPVAAGQTYSVSLGDTTRANLISDPGLASAAAWTLGTGWSVAGGAATHASGSAGAIGQAVSLTSGKWYRFGFTVSGATTGTLRPRLTGGSDRLGEQTSTNDRHFDRIQAVTGNATVGWSASSTFNGSLDDLVVYLETAACLPAGTHHIWLEPQNAAGVPGPALGPITVEIV